MQKASLQTIKYQFNQLTKIYLQYKEQLKTASLLHNTLTKKYVALCEKLHVTPKISTNRDESNLMELLGKTPSIIPYYMDLNKAMEQHPAVFSSDYTAFVYGLILKASEEARLKRRTLNTLDIGSGGMADVDLADM